MDVSGEGSNPQQRGHSTTPLLFKLHLQSAVKANFGHVQLRLVREMELKLALTQKPSTKTDYFSLKRVPSGRKETRHQLASSLAVRRPCRCN